MSEDLLVVKNISKRFGGLQALDNVNFNLKAGEVHALVGENGAGKSTLMKILGGVFPQDSGSIILENKSVSFSDPKHSRAHGISVIFQELSVLLHLSITENVYLGRMPSKNGFVRWDVMEKEIIDILKLVNITEDPRTPLSNLNIAQRQLTEIAKAISVNSKIVIMDEPNSSLSGTESERLFHVIDELKKKNVGVIYVSHKLEEVLRIADRITVFRDGQYVDTIVKDKNTTEDTIIQMMVGRNLVREYVKRKYSDEKLLSVNSLSGNGFKNVSFDLYKGEILGFSGLVGAGRSEVMRAVFGSDKYKSGEIIFEGKKIKNKSPNDAIRNGIAMLQEDRKKLSLFLELQIKFNIATSILSRIKKLFFIDNKKAAELVAEYVEKLDIKTSHTDNNVSSLSGGNQQKTIIARWLLTKPKLLILDEPTHGVDVGAKSEIYKLIRKIADEGVGIILISSELPEIISMSDRVVVMHEGKIGAILKHEEASEENIMTYATGKSIS